jgi:hypothetical protein
MNHKALSASEIRDLLGQVEGIASVEVRQGPMGEIEALEIAVTPGAVEKRVVRDVESALMSGLGIRIDHQVIQIRRGPGGVTELGRPHTPGWETEEGDAPKSLSARFLQPMGDLEDRIRLERVRCEPDGELYCRVTVELEVGGERIERTVREADTGRGRVLAAGRAAVNAITDLLDEEFAIVLEGVEEFRISEASGLLALVRVRQGRTRKDFYGATIVNGDPPEAAARAVLDALNRFVESRERQHQRTSRKDTNQGGRFLTA